MKKDYSTPVFLICIGVKDCVLFASGIGVDEGVDFIDDSYGW